MSRKRRDPFEADVAQAQGMSWGRYKKRERARTEEDRVSDRTYRETHGPEIQARNKAYHQKKKIRLRVLERLALAYARRHPQEAEEDALRIADEEGDEA